MPQRELSSPSLSRSGDCCGGSVQALWSRRRGPTTGDFGQNSFAGTNGDHPTRVLRDGSADEPVSAFLFQHRLTLQLAEPVQDPPDSLEVVCRVVTALVEGAGSQQSRISAARNATPALFAPISPEPLASLAKASRTARWRSSTPCGFDARAGFFGPASSVLDGRISMVLVVRSSPSPSTPRTKGRSAKRIGGPLRHRLLLDLRNLHGTGAIRHLHRGHLQNRIGIAEDRRGSPEPPVLPGVVHQHHMRSGRRGVCKRRDRSGMGVDRAASAIRATGRQTSIGVPETGGERGVLPASDRMPVAHASTGLSAAQHGLWLFACLDRGKGSWRMSIMFSTGRAVVLRAAKKAHPPRSSTVRA